MSVVAGRTSRSFRYTLLDGGELAMELTIMSSMRETKAASARATTLVVASTVWKCYAVRGRRPAPWMIWHSRLLLATIASIGASGFWSLGLGLERAVLRKD